MRVQSMNGSALVGVAAHCTIFSYPCSICIVPCGWKTTIQQSDTSAPQGAFERSVSSRFFIFVALFRLPVGGGLVNGSWMWRQDGEPVSKNAEEFLEKGKEALDKRTGEVEQHKVRSHKETSHGALWRSLIVSSAGLHAKY